MLATPNSIFPCVFPGSLSFRFTFARFYLIRTAQRAEEFGELKPNVERESEAGEVPVYLHEGFRPHPGFPPAAAQVGPESERFRDTGVLGGAAVTLAPSKGRTWDPD